MDERTKQEKKLKINSVKIENFLGAKKVDVTLTRPIALFCGANGAGKSSIKEAVSMALTGETDRSGLKKDYGQLITGGKISGFCSVQTSEGVASIELPNGTGAHFKDMAALPYVLNAQQFTSLNTTERRSFLFGLMGIKTGIEATKARMIELGANAGMVDQIVTYLRGGFESAHKEAQAKARDEKAVWRNITGETYGEKKAATWTADVPTFDGAKLADLEEQLSKVDGELATLNQQLGAQVAAQSKYAEAAGRIDELREKAQKYARIQDKLLKDEEELKAWQGKVEATKQSANGGRKIGLVHDLARSLNDFNDLMDDSNGVDGYTGNDYSVMWGEFEFALNVPNLLEKYKKEHGEIGGEVADEEAKSKLPEYEKALQLMQNAVDNGKRDLAEADAAARELSEIEAARGRAEDRTKEINTLKLSINTKTGLKAKITVDINDLVRAKTNAEQAAQNTAKALEAHGLVVEWSKIADMLSPDGIPKEIMSSALGPINACLSEYCGIAEWGTIEIDEDMGISYARRDYKMLSESEKWRVDAMISAAVSKLSGIGLLVLDRFDVLDAKGREDLLAWLNELVDNGQIQTAMIFGTLNKVPDNLPPNFEVFLVKNGEIA